MTATDDFIADGEQPCNIQTAAATSSDSLYNGLNPPDVSVTVQDDDTAAINVSVLSSLVTSEAGSISTFTVILNSQPVTPVTVTVGSLDATECLIRPTSLIFDNTNWNIAQIVTITGQDDLIADGDRAYTITLTPTSTDSNYNSLASIDLSLTNLDNDMANLIQISRDDDWHLTEGTTDNYRLVLNSQPTALITITLVTDGQTNVVPNQLIFTPLNWNRSQTITVTAIDDDIAEEAHFGTITHTLISPDLIYTNLSPVALTINLADQFKIHLPLIFK